jgi:hypothetical protein
LYSGFIRRSSIAAATPLGTQFFRSATPDIYSAVALSLTAKRSLFTEYPFSLNGGSSHSNGGSQLSGSDVASLFFEELDIPQHPLMPIIAGAASSSVVEAVLQCNEVLFQGSLRLNAKRFTQKMLAELDYCAPAVRKAGLAALLNSEFSHPFVTSEDLTRRMTAESSFNDSQYFQGRKVIQYQQLQDVGVDNVESAAKLVYNIIGSYNIEKHPRSMLIYLTRQVISRFDHRIRNKVMHITRVLGFK